MLIKTLPNSFFIPNNTYILLPNNRLAIIETIYLDTINESLTYTTFLQGGFNDSLEERKRWEKYGFVHTKNI